MIDQGEASAAQMDFEIPMHQAAETSTFESRDMEIEQSPPANAELEEATISNVPQQQQPLLVFDDFLYASFALNKVFAFLHITSDFSNYLIQPPVPVVEPIEESGLTPSTADSATMDLGPIAQRTPPAPRRRIGIVTDRTTEVATGTIRQWIMHPGVATRPRDEAQVDVKKSSAGDLFRNPATLSSSKQTFRNGGSKERARAYKRVIMLKLLRNS